MFFNTTKGEIQTGDRIHGRVEAIGRDAGTTYLQNARTKKEYKHKFVNQTALLGSTNAEWVTECQTGYDPEFGFEGTYSANFTAWKFENAQYVTKGTTCPLPFFSNLKATRETNHALFFSHRQADVPRGPEPTNRHLHQRHQSRRGRLRGSRPPPGQGYLAVHLHRRGAVSVSGWAGDVM
jgi:hypothetical protein